MDYLKGRGPSLHVQGVADPISSTVMVQFTKATYRYVIRLNGGCGLMTAADAKGLYRLFVDAFRGDFKGAFLFGGTQMRLKANPRKIVPGITEVVPRIKKVSPGTVALGIVPRIEIRGNVQHLRLIRTGVLVYDKPEADYYTQIHPEQDMCVVIQGSADQGTTWKYEALFAQKAVQLLVNGAGWKRLLISYNGGKETEEEMLLWATEGWPVLLIKGSGRVAEKYARDTEFLARHPNVHLAEKNPESFRAKLIELGVFG